MKTEYVKLPLKEVKLNPKNPRTINKRQFEALKQSILNSPKVLELSPLILNEDHIVLGGNMRLKAITELGFTEVPCIIVSGLSDEKQKELVIKDNINYGDWDWNVLIDEWTIPVLTDMGLTLPKLFIETNETRGQDRTTIKEQFETWMNAEKQQIKLFYDHQTYDYVMEYLKTRGEDKKGETIQTLIDKYFDENNLLKDRR
jgi:hypothetical protein